MNKAFEPSALSQKEKSNIEPATRLGPYEIRSKIGEGGMGEVYLAEDTRLRRRVALKILPPHLAADNDRLARFEREAFAASALNHPNILTIFEFSAVDKTHFLVTEFVDGLSLRQRLARGALPVTETLDIAVQIASALRAAHDAGIIHRDIKPDNVMLRTDGYVKVLDFGLAKLSEPGTLGSGSGSDPEALTQQQFQTQTGVIMGTVGYMSPEQTRGVSVDTRSDIWSLGCVLYEMISGQQPFRGGTTADTVANIIHREPVSVSTLRTDVGRELEQIISRALAKDADERYQTAKEMVDDLKELQKHLEFAGEGKSSEARTVVYDSAAHGSATPTIARSPETNATPAVAYAQNVSIPTPAISRARRKIVFVAFLALILLAAAIGGYLYLANRAPQQINSIAVMPFVNASGNADVEYLSDGLTDSLIFRFSQLPNVKVSPTSSVMRFKNTTKDVADVARELNVDAVLSGRLMRAGDELSVSVQLIDARTQKLIWAEQYDRKMADLMATQREIAMTLTQKMQLQLAADERGITKKYTTSNEAYQLYLKGRYHWSRRFKEDMLKAIDNYQEAIKLDPNFALAYAATAEVYNSMGKNTDVAPKECIPLAKAAATRALEIDPQLPQAHSALADSLALYDWNWTEAERHFKKALELDPNIAYTHVAYGLDYLAAMGKADLVVVELQRGLELEPLSMINNSVLTSAYIYDRKYDQALVQARTTIDLNPQFPLGRVWLGFALIEKGKYEEALSAIGQVPAPGSHFDWMSVVVLASAYAKQGKRAEAEQQISRLREQAKTHYVRTYHLAAIYATLGDKDKAFAELEESFAERDCFLGRIAIDPAMDPLRDDPRFKNILKKMNLSK
jgi:serine/threonine-protein kinase